MGQEGLTEKDPDFLPTQIVRIKQASELRGHSAPAPGEHAMGKTGIVEMAGMVYVMGDDNGTKLVQAYFMRIDGIGQVLAGENWVEGPGQPVAR
ncbi:MAG TPA: hypothetical protein DCE26_00660 [Dehalococcoidia bacterium]|nr:hypothetical protein [Chloroflexota bacterium]HAA94187.1 hypothetical protein [Dehalococcoidia bacterium]|tara:strand:- start:1249 stop:1530 length:282 start_codon:yes stop_codon:yes gene_type:complete